MIVVFNHVFREITDHLIIGIGFRTQSKQMQYVMAGVFIGFLIVVGIRGPGQSLGIVLLGAFLGRPSGEIAFFRGCPQAIIRGFFVTIPLFSLFIKLSFNPPTLCVRRLDQSSCWQKINLVIRGF